MRAFLFSVRCDRVNEKEKRCGERFFYFTGWMCFVEWRISHGVQRQKRQQIEENECTGKTFSTFQNEYKRRERNDELQLKSHTQTNFLEQTILSKQKCHLTRLNKDNNLDMKMRMEDKALALVDMEHRVEAAISLSVERKVQMR